MQRKKYPLIAMLLFLCIAAYAQIGINSTGTAPDGSAMLDVSSTTKGTLLTRMSSDQRDQISLPATGLLIYNTNCNNLNLYNGTKWVDMMGNAAIAPSAPVATAATGISPNQITANWNAVTSATGYLLDVSSASNFTTFVDNALSVGNVLTYNITGLTAGTTYYYRVRAVNGCGAGGYSDTITTTTSTPGIAFDATSMLNTPGNWEGGSNTFSWSHTCSGTNRILIVGIYDDTQGGNNVSGVTYHGASMTLLAKVIGEGNIPDDATYLYYLINPDAGTYNITITGSSNFRDMTAMANSYTGAKQSGQPTSSNTDNNSSQSGGSSYTISTTPTVDNCWLVGIFRNGGSTLTGGANTLLRQAFVQGDVYMGDSNSAQTPANTAHSMTVVLANSPSSRNAMVIGSIAPAP